MRLFKLMAYALFGYALYEFVRGMTQIEQQQAGGQGGGGGAQMGGGQSRGQMGGGASAGGQQQQQAPGQQNITGPGEGRDIVTADADGGAMHHRVGRGVVSKK